MPSTERTDAPSNLNIANVLTVIRLLGVPVFGWLLLVDGGHSIDWRVWAFLAFALLMITDKIDGDLARKHHLITDFGKLADPIADKALTGMAFVGLAIVFADQSWGPLFIAAVVIMLVREWGITILRGVLARRGVVQPANRGGKLKTLVQAMAVAGYLLPFELWDGLWAEVLRWAAHGFMVVAFALTVVTGVQYVMAAKRGSSHVA